MIVQLYVRFGLILSWELARVTTPVLAQPISLSWPMSDA